MAARRLALSLAMDCAQARNSDTNRHSPSRASCVFSPGLSMPFGLMCLAPAWFAPLALGFAALCVLTTAMRIAVGVQVFGSVHTPR